MSFETLGLKAALVSAADALGYDVPTPIQAAAIPVLLQDRTDVIGRAQTGTGKTAAFGLPLIQRIDPARRRPQAVVLSPTRELCLQITGDMTRYGANIAGLRCAAVYGGAGIADQMRRLNAGVQVLVATPGRLLDLIRRRAVNVREVSLVVLDEADEMLNMGFKEELDGILAHLPEPRRTWLFSATMPRGVAAVSESYLNAPVTVAAAAADRGLTTIAHTCHVVRAPHRYQALRRLIDSVPDMYGLIFCRTRKDTQTVADALSADGFPAAALHGDLSQVQRDAVMGRFRRAQVPLMVATDVAARGIDVNDITHVIHYHLPGDVEAYTHRSGRTARAGKTGRAVVIATRSEMGRVRLLEKQLGISFSVDRLPDGKAVRRHQIAALARRIRQPGPAAALRDEDVSALGDALADLDRDALIRALVPETTRQLLARSRDQDDLDAAARPMGKAAAAKRRLKGARTRRFVIDIGRDRRVNEGAILRMVCEAAGIRSHHVGAIDLRPTHCVVEVDRQVARIVEHGVRHARMDGRRVSLKTVSDGPPPAGRARLKSRGTAGRKRAGTGHRRKKVA